MKFEVSTKDMYGEETKKIYLAEKIVSSKGSNYKYTCELGIKNDIYFLSSKVLINRMGEISAKQVFDIGQITKSLYKTPYLETELNIKTLSYEKSEKAFSLFYKIYSNNELLNEIFVNFKEV